MPRVRFLLFSILILGLAAGEARRSTGALSESDALVAAAAVGANIQDPALRFTSRFTGAVVRAARALEPGSELFPLVHLAASVLLAGAAAMSAGIAALSVNGGSGAATAAGIAVGAGVLFGRTTGFGGVAGGGVAMTLALLSGGALAWIAPRPQPFAGGLLLGLACVEHPFAMFAIPGFLAAAIGMELRDGGDDPKLLRRAAAGFVVGLLGMIVPGSVGDATALARFASPSAWIPNLVLLAKALWFAAGPLGLLAAIYGFGALHDGAARRARPFLLVFLVSAVAGIFVTTKDQNVLHAITCWGFLFFLAPAAESLSSRLVRRGLPKLRAALFTLGAAIALSTALFLMNRASLDARAERGLAWARDSFDRLSENGILFTANPVHWALVSDGQRPDLDVVLVDEPRTIKMRQSILGLFAPNETTQDVGSAPAFARLLADNIAHRPVFFDPTLFFQVARRDSILAGGWQANPFGIAFRIGPTGVKSDEAESKASAVLWDEYDLTPGTPPSAIRGGLGGDDYYARSLLQSASLNLENGLPRDAEREFLFALTLEKSNPNLARFGLARIFLERQNFEEVIGALEGKIDPARDGAWLGYRMLGVAFLRLGETARAIPVLEEAQRLCPAQYDREQSEVASLLKGAREGRRLPGRVPVTIPRSDRER